MMIGKRLVRRFTAGTALYKISRKQYLLATALVLILIIIFFQTGGSEYWLQPFLYSNTIRFEDESISEDFVLFGDRACSSSRKLHGKIDVTYTTASIDDTALLHPDLEPGGHYIPKCEHSEKVAIIVPYRNRLENLGIFLYNMHKILKRQQIEYRIFIIEQADTEPFNRATLFNVGFVEASKLLNFTCVIFHDVDLIPDDDRNIYRCPPSGYSGRHMAAFMSSWNYTLPYLTFFGGVVALGRNHFEQMNGCSNRFWGWGAEDDDMYNRVLNQNYYVTRYSKLVSRYTMLGHKVQDRVAHSVLVRHVDDGYKYFKTSGLSDLKYTLVKIDTHRLCTFVEVRLVLAS